MDLSVASASFLAAAVRNRQIGCLELLDYFLARVERLDGAVNAVVVRDFDRARDRARALDNGPITGKLHGVPMTLKESFNVAGLPTSWGVPENHGKIATSNALAVDRLMQAGAVVFGKTNIPRMLGEWQSFNANYGRTNNPWNLDTTPGGSSGGGAAAIAAGFCGLEAGSDIGGSIRQPAHACGIFGHKPTHGLLPLYGHALAENASTTDISCIGPLARSAEDLGLALDVMAGPDAVETALQFQLPPPRTAGLRGLRVAVWADQPGQSTDPAITTALLGLANMLEREGAIVDRTARPAIDVDAAYNTSLRLLAAALSGRATEADRVVTRARSKELGPDDKTANSVLFGAVDMTHAEWLGLNEQRHRMRRTWGAFFHDWDVLLCPALGAPTWGHMNEGEVWRRRLVVNGQDISYNDLLFWPLLTGVMHLPASVAPLGQTTSGLPFGVQIAGPLFGDRTTIAVAALLERAWRGFTPPPGFA
ncbi:amidase [Acidisphaera sp. L21]|uniref:amidase n=1 Tax=Acidisphaera sp. L21 TaxID=1641851 RepID=UPI00131B6D62|nr:amidase [Acidisphaera sp. L21]